MVPMFRTVQTCRQGFFVGGLILTGIYAFVYKLWPIAIPMIAELTLMITLIILKVYFDNFGPNSVTREGNETQLASDSANKVEEGRAVLGGVYKYRLQEGVRAELSGNWLGSAWPLASMIEGHYVKNPRTLTFTGSL